MQTDNKKKDDAHAAEIKTLKLGTAVDFALSAAKVRNVKAVRALLDIDIEKAELADDGTIKGLAERIKELQEAEDSKFLFEIAEQRGAGFRGVAPGEGGGGPADGDDDPFTKVMAKYDKN